MFKQEKENNSADRQKRRKQCIYILSTTNTLLPERSQRTPHPGEKNWLILALNVNKIIFFFRKSLKCQNAISFKSIE